MSPNRLALTLISVLLALVWAGAASAQGKTYLLSLGSGAQLQIGGGLPLPIQLTDANMDGTVDWGAEPTKGITVGSIPGTFMGPGAAVWPPLLIPRAAPGVTVMDTAPGGALTIPAGVLARPAAQNTLGQNSQNPSLFAVATNLGWKWPAATAMLSARTMTLTALGGAVTFPANATTQYLATTPAKNGKIRYVNQGVAAPFGGPANVFITPMFGSGIKPSVAVTVFGIVATPPPCAGCPAALIKAAPTATQAAGGKAFSFVTTVGGNVAPPDIWAIAAGATPKGTILATFGPIATGPAPTNMAASYGFFWTTGRITVSAPAALGTPERFVLSGADARTASGGGTIQLVGGALADRVTSGPNANRGWVKLILCSPNKTPSISGVGLVLLTGLMLGTAVVVGSRRRRAAEAR